MCRAHCAQNESDEDFDATASTPGVHGTATATSISTNLRHFHPSRASFNSLPQGEFSVVKRVASGIHGDVFAYRWQRACVDYKGQCVAVKKLRFEAVATPGADVESDERRTHFNIGGLRSPYEEDALTEIGVLQRLAKNDDLPLYILKLLGVYKECAHIWLVTEFADGGELFNEIVTSGPMADARAMRCCWEILQAISYLHRNGISHRDISLENILLRDGAVRVMDFGMAVQSRNSCGTPLRYFRKVGKPGYRAPECYVPPAASVDIVVPAGAEANSIVSAEVNREFFCEVLLPTAVQPNCLSTAQVSGYAAPPADVFAVGVCLFIMLTGTPPWRDANLKDEFFNYVRAHGLLELRRSWGMPPPTPKAAEVLLGMTAAEPALRLSADECLGRPWFNDLACAAVHTHAKVELQRSITLSLAGA